MGHLPSLTEPWEPSTRVFVYSVGTADGPDESVRDAFVLDEGPYPERDALRAVLRDLEQCFSRYHLPWDRREVPRDQVPADLPDWAVYRDRLVNGIREYFALLLPGGTVQNPSGILRRITGPSMSWGQSLGRDGTWRPTEYFRELDRLGSAVGDAVPITVEQARAVAARWQAAGLVPEVDFETARYQAGQPEYFSAPDPAEPPATPPPASNVRYYSFIADFSPDKSVDNPSTIYRRTVLDNGGTKDEAFTRDGTWRKNEYWLKVMHSGDGGGDVVEISPEQASTIIHRWYDEGRRPRVPGVDIPSLPGDPASGAASPAAVVTAAPATPTFRRAKLFDGIDQASGRPVVDRSQLPSDEAARVLAYLTAGAMVMSARTLTKDLFFPDDPPQVPVSFETDGVWIWGGGVRYYLERYGLPPEPEFLAHIRANGYAAPDVPPDVRAAARDAFLAASAEASAQAREAAEGEGGPSAAVPPATPPTIGAAAPVASEPRRVPIQYYARTAPGRSPQDPIEILYTITGEGDLVEQVMGRDGAWHDTDVFARLRASGGRDETLAEITPPEAAVVLYRWRETGVIPLVEGVVFPALPAVDGPGPAPGSGPVDAAAAQAIGDAWVNASGFSPDRIRAGIYEFDLGYIVYPLAPVLSGQNVGSARGVIDRSSGRLSLWPSYPFNQVAQMYRSSLQSSDGLGVDEFEEEDEGEDEE